MCVRSVKGANFKSSASIGPTMPYTVPWSWWSRERAFDKYCLGSSAARRRVTESFSGIESLYGILLSALQGGLVPLLVSFKFACKELGEKRGKMPPVTTQSGPTAPWDAAGHGGAD